MATKPSEWANSLLGRFEEQVSDKWKKIKSPQKSTLENSLLLRSCWHWKIEFENRNVYRITERKLRNVSKWNS